MPRTKGESRHIGQMTSPPSSLLSSAPEQLITIMGSRGSSMGFSVRGGAEFGLGIYVSSVKRSTPAEAGLRPGDQIIKANGVDFHCIANSSAVRVLSSSELLNLIVVRTGQIPEWKIARERVLWYDVSRRQIVSRPPVSEVKPRTGDNRNRIVDRKVLISITKQSDFIGLNIRGGREYGIGIYVSRVDEGGLACQVGLTPGDQIVQINDTDCQAINHSDAVDVLRSSKTLIITLRSVGKYPVFKELYAEYSWSDVTTQTPTNSSVTSRFVLVPPDSSSGKYSIKTQARESSIDFSASTYTRRSVSHTHLNTSDGEELPDDPNDSFDESSQVCYPEDKDIMFRRNAKDSWHEKDYHSHSDIHRSSASNIIRQESSLSDQVLDYTAFLERTVSKEKTEVVQPTSTLYRAPDTPSEDYETLGSVVSEQITSFSSLRRRSASSGVSAHEVISTVHRDPPVHSGIYQHPLESPSPASTLSSGSSPIYATVNKRRVSASSVSTQHSQIALHNGVHTADENPAAHQSSSRIPSITPDLESQIRRLEARKSDLGSREITRMSVDSDPSDSSSQTNEVKTKMGTWTSLKQKIKGSLRIHGPGHNKRHSLPSEEDFSQTSPRSTSTSIPMQQKGVFERSFGSQLLNTQKTERYNLMGMLEDRARTLLQQDEYKAVMRHIHSYHENKELERLVELLLAILDKPEKQRLLLDVRNVIAPGHIAIFDSLVADCHVQPYHWPAESADEVFQPEPDYSSSPGDSFDTSTRPLSSDTRIQPHSSDTPTHSHNHLPQYSVYTRKDFEKLPASLEIVVFENDDTERNRRVPLFGEGEEIVYISKHKTALGLEICGGRGDRQDQRIRIKHVTAGSAAADDKRLQPGVQITKVNGQPVDHLSCEEARSLLHVAFLTKIPVNLGIQIKRP